MKAPRLVALYLLSAVSLVHASPANDPAPRVIARMDVALLALPNVSAQGGGGVSIPIRGTGAGLTDAGGAELGAEVRLWRWIALDAGTGWYRPKLEVGRDRGSDVMADSRSATVNLRTFTLGLIVTPPKWRFEQGRVAVGALMTRAEIEEVPSHLGIYVEESSTGIGVDFRGEFFFSKNRHWGIGGALSFTSGARDSSIWRRALRARFRSQGSF